MSNGTDNFPVMPPYPSKEERERMTTNTKEGTAHKTAISSKKQAALTYEKAHELFIYFPETGIFHWRNTGGRGNKKLIAGCADKGGYSIVTIGKKPYYMHRLAWLMHYGEWPNGMIDHKDHNRHNNAIDNLRVANISQNNMHRMVLGKPLPRGVRKLAGSYSVNVRAFKKNYLIGHYETPEEAAHAYNKAAILLQGEFAILNPIGVDKNALLQPQPQADESGMPG